MGNRIMIVQTEFVCKMMMEGPLQKNGYEIVAETWSGAECVELYREQKPDLVILDMVFFDKANFWDVLSALRNEDPPATVLVCNSLMNIKEHPETVMEVVKRGASGYLYKPFRAEQLLKEVGQLLKN